MSKLRLICIAGAPVNRHLVKLQNSVMIFIYFKLVALLALPLNARVVSHMNSFL